ncbi:UDP-N-acetylenolpyruvoylglucosamine reductase [Candidatus Kuenenbacteria bacterium HGW-Kuenenbacteria-1]|uniref:UDP-N-acetylenolpyruvoylglucosamine reductase n=1 Tax=Candidatus Kuenenbacteria bacterium HGW-Kuenenbacteria-1 TaxID=2013812 RepID=A0A2N1UN91_9BACT|nr:MAG: UDP-N-acetylenolpyruvoylglucosamine reductase [Candidatus Kuenenbacteria bacterium HGW-Kuenenbacteria-1]
MTFDNIKDIQKNISLASYTTFKIGGTAKYFYLAKNTKDLIKIIEATKQEKIPFFVLGGGSNILVKDQGFDGLAIKIQSSKFKIQNCNSKFKIICDSGTLLGKLVQETSKKGIGGLEWFIGIPGTIGGAVYGNAGWPKDKKNIGDFVKNVTILKNGAQFTISNLKCQFGYRDSIFKHNNNVILSVELQLPKGDSLEIKKRMREILLTRITNTSQGNSAGCIFKNIKLGTLNKKLFEKYPKLKNVVKNNFISAGYLIDQCGLKGKKIGKAIVSEKHANFIINTGQAKAEDVVMLISLIKQKVRDKFNVQLQEEIQYIGF